MGGGFEETKEALKAAVIKFFSLIIAGGCGLGALVYFTGVLKYESSKGSFEGLDVVSMVGCVFAAICAIMYAYLFFVARKPYRLMYLLSATLVVGIFFVSHSLGVTGPTVADCNEEWSSVIHNITDMTGQVVDNIKNASSALNSTVGVVSGRGTYDQELTGCSDTTIIFAGAFIANFFMLIAVFDVQRMLLKRVRAKTYGQRFQEMGIS